MSSTSGSFQGNDVTIGGNGGNHIFTNWQLASQNVAGDYSTINWQTYFHFNSADAQLDNGSTTSNVGTLWSNGGRVYNYAGNFTTRDLALSSGSFNVPHDSVGNGALQLGNSIVVYNVGTSAATSGVWTLPTIPRYANITSYTQSPVTDEEIQLNWSADTNCDYVTWWSSAYDGGGHHDIPVSGSGGFVITLHNLTSSKTYDFTVAVRRQDSGLWTTSGTAYPATLSQNGFFNTMGL